ncbi:MAG: PAS domain S-box protein, partial [Thermodesulfobacteriota bacterium]
MAAKEFLKSFWILWLVLLGIVAATAYVPAAKYDTGWSWTLWGGSFGVWISVPVMMLILTFRSFRERHKVYMELQHAHNSLESRVQERTAELAKTNANLRKEMMERAKAEKDCLENEARYRELAELLPQIVFETDASGKFTFMNHGGLAATGYTANDLARSISVWDVISSEGRARALTDFRRVMQGGTVADEQYEASRKDGVRFPVVAYVAPIQKDKQIVGVRGVAVDI